MAKFRSCPWCLGRVDQVDGVEYRRRVLHRRNLVNLAMISDRAPCWFCRRCGAGGIFVGSPG